MSAPALLSNAHDLLRRHDVDGALAAFHTLTTRYPAYADGWFARSAAQSMTARGLSAIASAREAVRLDPRNALHRAHLAQVEVNYGLWGDALRTLTPMIEAGPVGIEAKVANSVGTALSLCGCEAAAQAWFAAAAARAPGVANYAYNHAQGLMYCGRLQESAAAFDRLLARFPDFAKAHWSLSTFDPAPDDARVARLRQALHRAASAVDEVMYCYALFNTLDALDRPREAFVELDHGMRLQRARIAYAGEDTAMLRAHVEAGRRWLQANPETGAPTGPTPVFILGLPRTGTTLVERIVGNHPDVAQGGELTCMSAALREALGIETINPMLTTVPPARMEQARVDPTAIAQRYLALGAHKHEGRRLFTDKYPFNFMLVPWIARAFPAAPIIHMQRDPVDTCFSNLKQLFSAAYGACYSQPDMARFHDAYMAMMQAWDEALPGRILHVDYERLVRDPQAASAEILDFCGLGSGGEEWRIERNARPVSTASAAQVRQPINTRGLGAWRRYEAELQPLARHFAAHAT